MPVPSFRSRSAGLAGRAGLAVAALLLVGACSDDRGRPSDGASSMSDDGSPDVTPTTAGTPGADDAPDGAAHADGAAGAAGDSEGAPPGAPGSPTAVSNDLIEFIFRSMPDVHPGQDIAPHEEALVALMHSACQEAVARTADGDSPETIADAIAESIAGSGVGPSVEVAREAAAAYLTLGGCSQLAPGRAIGEALRPS